MNSTQETYRSNFFKLEAAGGIILMFAAMLALIFANTPLQSYYALFLDIPLEVRIGAFGIAKPLLLWINDGLMAIFFFLVGLELKRELVEGESFRTDATLSYRVSEPSAACWFRH